MRSKVALIRCESYEIEEVRAGIKRGLELLGGAASFVKSGEKILLKPNLLAADPPEKCTTTHPAVFQAVAETFQEAGAILSYGDSPGFHRTETAAQKAGLVAIAEKLNFPLADFVHGEEVSFPDGVQNKKFTIAKGVLESDGIISLPKLKMHALTRMTGAIKNQFGCIPGTLKAEFHAKLPDPFRFAAMLVDLCRFIKPRLYVMDGIIAMEGNGPRGGKPKPMNLILLSSDPVALDATVCRIIKMDPTIVPTLKPATEAGLGIFREEDIELVGDPLESFQPESFDAKRERIEALPKGGFLLKLVRALVLPRPVIDEKACIRCGVCAQACPATPKALDWDKGERNRPPVYRYDRCIRCYCCQELCPQSVITVKEPWLSKLIFRRERSKK